MSNLKPLITILRAQEMDIQELLPQETNGAMENMFKRKSSFMCIYIYI